MTTATSQTSVGALTPEASTPPDLAPLISVIVPCYNGGQTIQRCIESLVEQSHRPHETIVVDDRSTDMSVELLRGLPVTIVSRALNGGAAAARADGAAKAKGEIFAFLDADCIEDPCSDIRQHGHRVRNDRSFARADPGTVKGNDSPV